ncbi:MAG: ATP-binding protein [Blastocatellales bacterium]
MRAFRILIVDDEDDELGWPKTFSKNIRTVPLADLVGDEYGELVIEQATNQADADKTIAENGPRSYDLILLDLRYPLTPDGWPDDDEASPASFQGMEWLPKLRRLQPEAAIVIVTGFAEDEQLYNAVKAIRDHHANDFIPKTESFSNLVARIRVAWGNAMRVKQLARFEEEFHNLVRTRSIRAYSEDVGSLLTQAKTSLFNIAKRIESGDSSELAAAADMIRSQFSRLRKEFDELTSLLNEGRERLKEVDVAELIRQMLMLYRRMIESAQARVQLEGDQQVWVNTYEGDLKVSLHELITNAIDSLKTSDTLPDNRLLEISAQKVGENVVVRVTDNGDGFSGESLERLYERGYTTKREDGKHQGLGLYISRRMMRHIGGDIRAANRKEGGAKVTLTFKDLRQP